MIEFMRTLPLVNKVKTNFRIWKHNLEKKEQDQRFLENPDVLSCLPASPQASLWSYTGEEEETLKSRSMFETVKAWLIPEKAMEIEKHLESAGNASDTGSTLQAAAGSKKTNKIPIPEVVERKCDDSVPKMPPFPDFLYDYADYCSKLPIPLSLFTHKNLDWLHANQHSIKTHKKSNPSGTYQVIEMPELLKLMNVVQDKLEGLMYSQFREASEHWWAFEITRETKHGCAFHAKWARKHLSAIEAFQDKEEMYELWKPMEQKLRSECFSHSWMFETSNYTKISTIVEGQVKTLEMLKEAEKKREAKRRRFNNDNHGQAKQGSTSNPFPGGSKGKSRLPCCFLCARRGHRSTEYDLSRDGAPLWALAKNSKIIHPKTKKPLCVPVRKATAVAPQVTQSSLFCCVHYGLTKWLS
ncbi:hypothetical protein PQX77_016080 [Marasmius sp. AFHP31]|nr:hypothetical protein PQX77_016080 [Marasmius sp. AFHP31]